MSDDRAAILKKVKDLVLEQLGSYPADIYLFGSYARGDTRRSSDIDVAVDPTGPLPSGALARLREALDESTIPRRVEVLDLRDADPDFRDRVRREGIRWNAFESA